MNIQIFGKNKCFETKKAQRYFKERGIKFQFVDISKYPMSKGEYTSVKRALKLKAEEMTDPKSKSSEYLLLKYLADENAKDEKLLENQDLFITPIVRNKNKATLGYHPEEWKKWEEEEK